MKSASLRRAVALVSALFICCINVAIAHALPSSVLVFSQINNQLTLSINVPLEELLVADVALSPLAELSENESIPADLENRVAAYFSNHLQLQNENTDLLLKFVNVSIQAAEKENVGVYKLLKLKFTATLNSTLRGSMMLKYDAVMHEVRTHKATIYWEERGSDAIFLMTFSFKKNDGSPKPILFNTRNI